MLAGARNRMPGIALLLLVLLLVPLSYAEPLGAANPLLHSTGALPDWRLVRPEHVLPAVRAVLNEEGASLELLEQDLERALVGGSGNLSYSRVFQPYTQIRLRLDSVFTLIEHLAAVADGPALRDALDAAAPLRVKFELRLSQSAPLHTALRRLRRTPELWGSFNEAQRRVLSDTLRGLDNSGVALPPDQRRQFNAIADELSQLSSNYSENVLDATKASAVLVRDVAQLTGLRTGVRALAAQHASDAGHTGASTAHGPWLLSADYSTYAMVLTSVADSALRRRMWNTYQTLASRAPNDNGPIVQRMLKLRKQHALLLGYPSFADMSFSSKMATLPEASDLLKELTTALHPATLQEERALLAFARNASGQSAMQLAWWDRPYWAERMKEARFGVRADELSEYLPLNRVLDGLFKTSKELFGVEVRYMNPQPPVWHPDVAAFALYSEQPAAQSVSTGNNQTVGGSAPEHSLPTGKQRVQQQPTAFFYADLFARPGEKQGGAWSMPLWDAARYWRAPSPAASAAGANVSRGAAGSLAWSAALAAETASWLETAPKQVPVGALVTNFQRPASGRPSLLTLADAATLWHEFGHVLQHTLSTTPEGLVAGTRGIEWDAVEVPSQTLEKLVSDEAMLNSIAAHWQTGKPIPRDLFARVKGMRRFRGGDAMAYQVVQSVADIVMHGRDYDPAGPLSATAVLQQQYRRIMAYPPNPTDRPLMNFPHIFAGSYAAAYYSYLWADVMAADLHAAFQDAGPSNSTAAHALGRSFRDAFLASGGSVHPRELFLRVRGRSPRVQPLLRFSGLSG